MSLEGSPVGDLVVRDGWLVDPLTAARLHRLLSAAPPDVVGIAARPAVLAPGASWRVAAEWACLDARPPHPAPPDPVAPAAVVRAGARHQVGPDGVAIPAAAGRVLVDPGSVAHDPASTATLAPGAAVPEGRSPFPRRAMVLVVDRTGDDELAAWAADLADGLVAAGLEARVAGDGPVRTRLSRPCLPTAEAVATLAPDVVVALDGPTEEAVAAWCAPHRGTAVVRLDRRVRGARPTAWRLGEARGRTRGLVGLDATVDEVADLVHRLAAGPLPGPPRDPEAVLDLGGTRRRRHRPAPEVAVLDAAGDAASARRVARLVDVWTAGGAAVQAGDDAADHAAAVGLAVVVGATVDPDLAAVLAARRRRGRPTLVEVRQTDLVAPLGPDGPAVADLTPEADALLVDLGQATFASAALGDRLHLGPVRRLVVPTPLATGTATAAARLARRARPADADLVVAWHLPADDGDDRREVVATALAHLLDAEARARVLLTGEVAGTPADLRHHDRVAVVAGEPDLEDVARAAVAVATPTVDEVLLGEHDRLLAAVACGVPALWAAPDAAEERWLPARRVGPDHDAEAWAALVAALLHDPRRAARAAARGRARAVPLVDPTALAGHLEDTIGRAGGGAEP